MEWIRPRFSDQCCGSRWHIAETLLNGVWKLSLASKEEHGVRALEKGALGICGLRGRKQQEHEVNCLMECFAFCSTPCQIFG